jgi:hypothetical protein
MKIVPFCFVFFWIAMAMTVQMFGQSAYKNVMVAPALRLGPCEPSIAISPKNPKVMVVGTVLSGVHHSVNGGKTWTNAQLKSSMGVWGDPVLLANSKGVFFYFHLSDPDGTNWRSPNILDRIVVQRSTDGGIQWSDGAGIGLNRPKQQDKPWAVVAPGSNRLYCTWTEFDRYKSTQPEDRSRIMFSTANQDGNAWSKPVVLSTNTGNCLDDNGTAEGAVPAAGPNGEVYVAWALNEKIYFNRSLDSGQTWWPMEQVIAQQPGGWRADIPGIRRANGFPVTVTDLSSSPYRGSLYVMWSDTRNGEDNDDIWISWSRDRGNNWSDAVRVNNDTGVAKQFFPWVVVDQHTGVLYAVFYDRRNYNDDQTDVYLATSLDGGQTWANERISESPFIPKPDVFFGDYNNIAAFKGIVRPVWTRYEDGKTVVMTALIKRKKDKVRTPKD